MSDFDGNTGWPQAPEPQPDATVAAPASETAPSFSPAWAATPDPSLPLGEMTAEPPPTRRRRNAAISAVALVAIIAVIAGIVVSRGSNAPAPAVVLSSAAGKTTGHGTGHMAATVKVEADGVSQGNVKYDADQDYGQHRVAMEICSAGGMCVERIRVVDGVTYVQSPRVPLPHGAGWVAITAKDVGSSAQAKSAASGNPSDGLDFLSVINNDSIVDKGEGTAGGVKVHNYEFTVDLKSMMNAIAKGGKKLHVPQMAEGLKQLDGLVDLSKLPASASIDGQGRVRTFTYTLEASEEGHTMKAVGSLNYSDFNKPVTVDAPQPSEVIAFSDFPDFFQKLAGG